jgi:hypothetical protein
MGWMNGEKLTHRTPPVGRDAAVTGL